MYNNDKWTTDISYIWIKLWKIYIYIYICGTWGPFNNHSGSILLLGSPFTNINLHVTNPPKYDFCSCLGGVSELRQWRPPHNGDICTTRKMTSSSYMGHVVKQFNNLGYLGGPWQCLGEDFNNRIGPISVRIYHLIYVRPSLAKSERAEKWS